MVLLCGAALNACMRWLVVCVCSLSCCQLTAQAHNFHLLQSHDWEHFNAPPTNARQPARVLKKRALAAVDI